MTQHPQKTILVLYAKYGAGHIQVADALKHAFLRHGVSNVILLDLFHKAHPLVDATAKWVYRKSFTWFPRIYGWSYYSTQDMQHDRLLSRQFNSFGLQTLRKAIEEYKPDVVINTFPMLAMQEFRRQTGQRIPTYAVITDFDLHNRWIHPEIDKYYVATEELAQQLVDRGVQLHQVAVSGIPIRAGFTRAQEAAQERLQLVQSYGFHPHKRKVLLSAGAYGVSWHWQDIIRLFHDRGWEVLVACGRNDAVRQELLADVGGLRGVHVFGYIGQMEELMKSADLLITKAGGITLSEAMSLELPTLILSPVPGQERENARYFEEKGAAKVIWSQQDFGLIEQLIDNPAALQEMSAQSAKLKKPYAAEQVVLDILDRLNEVNAHRGTLEQVAHS